MNGNDLFTALSGLDPKYIDEAAFELKEKAAPTKQPKTVSFRKIMYIAVPSAAAILLILAVSFLRCIGVIFHCRKVARDLADKCPQRRWLVGRDGIPGPEVCIIHTFLGVLLVSENIPRHSCHSAAVLFGKLGDRLF